ncbi:MAG: DUF6090 family protein [Parvularculaceae bacterium]
MILRRVIVHVKEQNWTAVFLDFVIVVFGVFIGIQLGNWNEARAERAQSVAFTRALQNDLRADAVLYRVIADYYSTARENGERVLASLEGGAELSDEELIVSAYRASQVAFLPTNRSTFDELVSTGRINLISEPDLRKLATYHFGADQVDFALQSGRQSDYRSRFRGAIPPIAHEAARTHCGDRVVDGKFTLEFACSLDLPPSVAAQAAAALRSDAALPEALRRRINQLDIQIYDMRERADRLVSRVPQQEQRP